MHWDHFLKSLDSSFSLHVESADGSDLFRSDAALELKPLVHDAAETDAERERTDEAGWAVVEEAGALRELLWFDYLSTPAGGALIWWLLDAGDGTSFVLYQPDDDPVVVFAKITGPPKALLGAALARFLGSNGEAFGVEESFTMLPDRIHNRAPNLVPEAAVREGCLAFLRYAESRYSGWEYLSKAHPNPTTEEEKLAAFADYWGRHYRSTKPLGTPGSSTPDLH